jgi:hypothetical protein
MIRFDYLDYLGYLREKLTLLMVITVVTGKLRHSEHGCVESSLKIFIAMLPDDSNVFGLRILDGSDILATTFSTVDLA